MPRWLGSAAWPCRRGTGGTVILGRVAAAPVLLVNGTMLSSQADEEAVLETHSNLRDAVWAACTVHRQATGVRKVLKRLAEDRLAGDLAALRDLVSDQRRPPHLRPSGEDAGRPGRIESFSSGPGEGVIQWIRRFRQPPRTVG